MLLRITIQDQTYLGLGIKVFCELDHQIRSSQPAKYPYAMK
jgi:hypothetical protein